MYLHQHFNIFCKINALAKCKGSKRGEHTCGKSLSTLYTQEAITIWLHAYVQVSNVI